MKNIVKWFELNFGWFFVNGRKQAAWAEYLRKKYNPVIEKKDEPTLLKESKTKGNVKPKTSVKKKVTKPKAQTTKKTV